MAFNYIVKKKFLQRPTHTIEEQVKYMQSQVFANAYKGLPIYKWYRRNVAGQMVFQPPPRLFCVSKDGRYNTNNPCPICRDEYLWFDYRNPPLIEMFLMAGTDQPIELLKSGLCREQYNMLKAQLLKAKEHGTLAFSVEFRHFDYRQWYADWKGTQEDEAEFEARVTRNETRLEDIYSEPDVLFKAHKRDVGNNWDEWWIRYDKFARKGK